MVRSLANVMGGENLAQFAMPYLEMQKITMEKLKSIVQESFRVDRNFYLSAQERIQIALGFDSELEKTPTDALRPIISDNACILL